MTKFLLLAGILAVIMWFWLGQRKSQTGRGDSSEQSRPTEAIVVCAHCRLHVPESEALRADGLYYCCDEHRKLGAS